MFENTAAKDLSSWEETIKHEITHALVFSPLLLKDFPGAGKYKRKILMHVDREFQMKHDVYMVITPRVRKEVRRHFNCSTLEGAELENQGNQSAGAHWEKRVFEGATTPHADKMEDESTMQFRYRNQRVRRGHPFMHKAGRGVKEE
ncbi:hypothetical protein TELCIR_01432 [Teladorsagia circumcincta]|uniref:Leishmanolysin-like peptidase n=1 Tax=Teladorsagia circumcincta TaxID=45464 RepID=A0A2G9V3F5_TELCI|nr:hypothetical protein TELCIR_01432 [Teladorsagia circumcincta]